MIYNYFRDYDAVTGRYVESDPIGLAGGLGTYSYVGGNPLRGYEPPWVYRRLEPLSPRTRSQVPDGVPNPGSPISTHAKAMLGKDLAVAARSLL